MRDNDWHRFIEKSFGGYMSVALSYTRSYVEAEDVVWGVYSKLLEKEYPLAELPTIGLKAVHNAGLNVVRHKAIRRDADIEFLYRPVYQYTTQKIDIDHILHNLPHILPPKQLSVIEAYLDKGTYKKAAEVVGLGVNTFKTNIHKARVKIRNEYPEYAYKK